MYKTQNGFNKASMIATIRARNKGVRSRVTFTGGTFGSCRYRSGHVSTGMDANPNMCAVGCFIPDELYDVEMEGYVPDSIVQDLSLCQKFPQLVTHMPLCPEGMQMMQGAHDRYDKDGDVRDALEKWINTNVEDSNG